MLGVSIILIYHQSHEITAPTPHALLYLAATQSATLFSENNANGSKPDRHMHPQMTFAMQSQNENLHIAAFPITPDFGADTSLEGTENSMAGARYYAITGQTWTFMPSVGTAAVFSPNGTITAQIEATEDYPARPILYHSVNTTGFTDTPAYDVNGEFSWSQMKQIEETYPQYIPHVMGNFTPRRLNSVEEMRKTGPIPLNY